MLFHCYYFYVFVFKVVYFQNVSQSTFQEDREEPKFLPKPKSLTTATMAEIPDSHQTQERQPQCQPQDSQELKGKEQKLDPPRPQDAVTAAAREEMEVEEEEEDVGVGIAIPSQHRASSPESSACPSLPSIPSTPPIFPTPVTPEPITAADAEGAVTTVVEMATVDNATADAPESPIPAASEVGKEGEKVKSELMTQF